MTMYEHFSAIKGVKPCLTPRYDSCNRNYYPRSNKQLPLVFTACNSYYIIQYLTNIYILELYLFNKYLYIRTLFI